MSKNGKNQPESEKPVRTIRKGGSRVYDQSGNLISEDTVETRKEKLNRSKPKPEKIEE